MKQCIVTIYIHGTLPPKPLMRLAVMHNFFYCPQGLSIVHSLDTKYHIPQFIDILCSTDDQQFEKEHFYIFGWNGRLRFHERKKAAHELYNQIKTLKGQYEIQGYVPIFKIITHSHGGNVALYLAPLNEEARDTSLTIDELILLACPVQVETEQYVNESIFNRVFSLHSHHDILQVLDPQGVHIFLESLKYKGLEFTLKHLKRLGPIFSSRHFIAAPHVVQLNVRHPGRELFHIEFLFPKTIAALPSLLHMMKNHTKKGASRIDDLTHILPH